jgi:hypothetical protein
MTEPYSSSAIRVEITGMETLHCFRMVLNPRSAPDQQIEVFLHARALVDLIYECSSALCDWQAQTTRALILQKTGLTEEEARAKGLIP